MKVEWTDSRHESGMDRLQAWKWNGQTHCHTTNIFFFYLAILYCGKISTQFARAIFFSGIKWWSVCAYLLHKRHQIFIPDKEQDTKSTTLRLGKEKSTPQIGIWTCNLSVPGPVLSLLSYTIQAHPTPPSPPPPPFPMTDGGGRLFNNFSPCRTWVSPCEQSASLLSGPRCEHSGWRRPWPAEGHAASPWRCCRPAAGHPASVGLWSSSGSCCASGPCSPGRKKLTAWGGNKTDSVKVLWVSLETAVPLNT